MSCAGRAGFTPCMYKWVVPSLLTQMHIRCKLLSNWIIARSCVLLILHRNNSLAIYQLRSGEQAAPHVLC
jgi:hypothetical protein